MSGAGFARASVPVRTRLPQVRETLPKGEDVLAFQCRNPIHRAHYELFIRALDAPNVGKGAVCLVHPTCGPTQVRGTGFNSLSRCSSPVFFGPSWFCDVKVVDGADHCLLPSDVIFTLSFFYPGRYMTFLHTWGIVTMFCLELVHIVSFFLSLSLCRVWVYATIVMFPCLACRMTTFRESCVSTHTRC